MIMTFNWYLLNFELCGQISQYTNSCNKNRVVYSITRAGFGPAEHLCRPKKVQVTGQTVCRRTEDHPGLVVKLIVRSGPFMNSSAFNSCISTLPRPLENTCRRPPGKQIRTRYVVPMEGFEYLHLKASSNTINIYAFSWLIFMVWLHEYFRWSLSCITNLFMAKMPRTSADSLNLAWIECQDYNSK